MKGQVTGLAGRRYTDLIWQRYKRSRLALWAWRGCLLLVIVALLGPFLANDKPLYAKLNGQHHFPAFKSLLVEAGLGKWSGGLATFDWLHTQYESAIRAPIPYHPANIDKANPGRSPFGKQEVRSLRFRHWLGTDALGQDVAAGMIRGAGVSLVVGVLSMLIAGLIGFFIGALAGYYGDGRMRMSRVRLIFNLLGLLMGFYYAFWVRSYLLVEGDAQFWEWVVRMGLFFAIVLLLNVLARPLERYSWLGHRVQVSVDLLIMRLIEAMNTIPGLFLLLAVLPLLAGKSIFSISLVLGLIFWPTIAQFVRGELLKVRQLQYIEAAQVLGYASRRIIWRHALPNVLAPALIVLAFGVAGAILSESALSFLGLGPDEATWGKLLSEGRQHISYWWLTVFPGLAIFLTVAGFNLVGDGLVEAMRE